jgi:hypothetical protein
VAQVPPGHGERGRAGDGGEGCDANEQRGGDGKDANTDHREQVIIPSTLIVDPALVDPAPAI